MYTSRPLIQIAMIFLKSNDDASMLKSFSDPHAIEKGQYKALLGPAGCYLLLHPHPFPQLCLQLDICHSKVVAVVNPFHVKTCLLVFEN